MIPRRGVLDASVLYPEPIRSLLLWIAAQGALDPFWTERILDETRRNLLEESALSPEQWERLRAAMLASFPDAMLDQVVSWQQYWGGDIPANGGEMSFALATGNRATMTTSIGRRRTSADPAPLPGM